MLTYITSILRDTPMRRLQQRPVDEERAAMQHSWLGVQVWQV